MSLLHQKWTLYPGMTLYPFIDLVSDAHSNHLHLYSSTYNVVFKEKQSGAVVGYQSYCIFASSPAAIHLGLRVDPQIRGKRLGMNFSERGDEEMHKLNPKVKANILKWSW